MPLKHGSSPDVVSGNIKEMMRSGRPRNQSIAAALSMKRKAKKMALGGEVEGNAPDPKNPIGYPSGASLAKGGTIGETIRYPKGASFADGGMVGSSQEFDENEDPMTPHKGHGAEREIPPMESLRDQQEDPEDYQTTVNENRMNSYSNVGDNEVANPNELEESTRFARALRRRAGMIMNVEEPEGYAMGGLVEGDHDPDMGNKPDEDMNDGTEEPMSSMPDPSGVNSEAMEALRMKKKARRFPSGSRM